MLLFPNQPFIEIDSVTFCFNLELFKEAWECGYNNINIEKTVNLKNLKTFSYFKFS